MAQGLRSYYSQTDSHEKALGCQGQQGVHALPGGGRGLQRLPLDPRRTIRRVFGERYVERVRS